MNRKDAGDDRLACFVCGLHLPGISMTRIILWLGAITIVSFAIGFGILALSGEFPPGSDQKATPFRNTVLMSPNTTSFALEGASSGDISILLGAGDLTVEGSASDGRLMEATVYSRTPEMQPEYTARMNGSTKMIAMTETGHKKKDWVLAHSPGSWENTWEVRMSGTVPSALTVNLGAGSSRLDLGSANLTSLAVNTGAGETTIDLSGYRGGQFTGSVHNGVGDLTLRVPKGSNTRIFLHHGVGDVTNQGFEKNDETYTTAGFTPALPVTEFTISQGVGSIQLEAV